MGCLYVEGGLVDLLPENQLAWRIWLDGETIGYETSFKMLDIELTEQEYADTLSKIRIIKNTMAEIQAAQLRRDGKTK